MLDCSADSAPVEPGSVVVGIVQNLIGGLIRRGRSSQLQLWRREQDGKRCGQDYTQLRIVRGAEQKRHLVSYPSVSRGYFQRHQQMFILIKPYDSGLFRTNPERETAGLSQMGGTPFPALGIERAVGFNQHATADTGRGSFFYLP